MENEPPVLQMCGIRAIPFNGIKRPTKPVLGGMTRQKCGIGLSGTQPMVNGRDFFHYMERKKYSETDLDLSGADPEGDKPECPICG